MTTVNAYTSTHFGRLVTGTGDSIDVGLELIGGRTLRMSLGGDELGAWPVEDCHIAPDDVATGRYTIRIDGDDAVFTPEDERLFEDFVRSLDGDADTGTGPDTAAFTDSDPDTGSDTDATPEPDDVAAFLFGPGGRPDPPRPLPTQDPVAPEPPLPPATGSSATSDPDTDTVTPPAAEAGPEYLNGSVPDADADADDDDGSTEDPVPGVDEDEVTDDDGVLLIVESDPVAGDSAPAPEQSEPVTDEEPSAGPVDDQPEPAGLLSSAFEKLRTVPDDGADELEGLEELDGAVEAEVDVGLDPTAPIDDDGEELRGRFGGSSLERLSSAIGALKESRPVSDEDEDEPRDGDEEELAPNTVATEVLESQRTLRDHRSVTVITPNRKKIGAIALGVVAVFAVLAFLTPRVWRFLTEFEGEQRTPATLAVEEERLSTTTTVVTTTTTPPTTVPLPPAGQTIFDRPAPEFVEMWNARGGTIDEVLEFDALLPGGPFDEELTAYTRVTGEVTPDGTLSHFTVVIDPTGPSEYDRIGIQALGVAIATADPARSPEGRATLLLNLGLNVRQPQLAGIDGQVESGGLSYTLFYDAEAVRLTLTVVPSA